MKNALVALLIPVYVIGDVVTFGKLTFFDCYAYTWWNWIIAVPLNFILSSLWPIYWGVLRPVFGGGC